MKIVPQNMGKSSMWIDMEILTKSHLVYLYFRASFKHKCIMFTALMGDNN